MAKHTIKQSNNKHQPCSKAITLLLLLVDRANSPGRVSDPVITPVTSSKIFRSSELPERG
jgi:hypothetical protein